MSIKQWIQGLLWPKIKPERDELAPHSYLCIGGPFHNTRLRLHTPSTMTFRLREFYGHYEGSRNGDLIKWVPYEEKEDDTAA